MELAENKAVGDKRVISRYRRLSDLKKSTPTLKNWCFSGHFRRLIAPNVGA